MTLNKIEDLSEEQKGRLTEDDYAELDLLLQAGENRTEDDEARLDELEELATAEDEVETEDEPTTKENEETEEEEEENQSVESEKTESDTTSESDASSETTEGSETVEEEEPETNPVETTQDLIPAKEIDGTEDKVQRWFEIDRIDKERNTHNQLWGNYYSQLSNGLACETGCFAIDVSKKLKAGDLVELPETATIRQSHRKVKAGDKNTQPATFDWLMW